MQAKKMVRGGGWPEAQRQRGGRAGGEGVWERWPWVGSAILDGTRGTGAGKGLGDLRMGGAGVISED